MSPDQRRICFSLDEVAGIVGDLMRTAEDLRTHSVEDVNARLIDMVADRLLDRAFGVGLIVLSIDSDELVVRRQRAEHGI